MQTQILIRTHRNLFKNCDYIFDFKSDSLSFYIHAMNFSLSFTHVINKTNKSVVISRRAWVNTLAEWDFITTYHINTEKAALAFKKKSQQLKFLNVNSTCVKTVLFNEVIIYKISNVINQFETLINKFSFLWDDYENTVNILEHK